MGRIRADLVQGTLSDALLTASTGAQTMNSAGLSSLPVVSAPDIAAIILDPAAANGAPEIVWVTAHTAAATTATVTRIAETDGTATTTVRAHFSGESWVHGPTTSDYTLGVNLSGALLAETSITPGTNYTTTSTTIVAIDTVNLALTFTVPASGRVNVRLSGLLALLSGANVYWSLLNAGVLVGRETLVTQNGVNNYSWYSEVILLTGLPAGSSYTIQWAWRVTASTANLNAGTTGPALMEVYDATLASNGAIAVTAAMNSDEAQASIISANAASDHFFGSALNAKWVKEAGASVTQVVNSCLSITSTTGQAHILTAFAPGSGAFRVEAKANQASLLIRDSGTGDASGDGMYYAGYSIGHSYLFSLDAGTYTVRASPVTDNGLGDVPWQYIALARDAANLWTAQVSMDRVTWFTTGTYTKAFTVAKVGTRVGGASSLDFIDVVDGTTGAQTGLVTAIPAGVAGQGLVVSSSGVPVWGGDTAWTMPTLLNSWVFGNAPYTTARFRKTSSGMVVMSGYITTGAANTIAFQLPVGYRPAFQLALCSPNGSINPSYLTVDATGNVRPQTGGPTGSMLDCSFYAEQ